MSSSASTPGPTAVHEQRRRTTGPEAQAQRSRQIETIDELKLQPLTPAEAHAPNVDADGFGPPVLWHGVELQGVTWANDDNDAAAGSVHGELQMPFLRGGVRIEVGDCGRPSGRYDVAATVEIAGHPLAELMYQAELTDGVPSFPMLDFDGTSLSIALPRPALAQYVATAGAEPVTTTNDDGTIVVDIARVGDLPPALIALFGGGGVAGDFDPAGRAAVLPPSVQSVVESVSGRLLDGLRLMVDALLTASGLPVDPATVEGGVVSVAPGQFDPNSTGGVALLARAIAVWLSGENGPVPASVTDPGGADVEAAGAGPGAPDPETAPDPAGSAEPDAGVVPDDAVMPAGETGSAPVDEAAGEGEAGGDAEGEVAEFELQMPPAPAEPTPAHQASIGSTRSRSASAQQQTQDLPTAGESTSEGRDAAVIPASEALGRAQQELATALEQQVEPSPEIIELCRNMRAAIREHRPVDEDELLDADLREPANRAGSELNDSVQDQGDAVGENYRRVEEPVEGPEPRAPQQPETPASSIGSPDLAAPDAAPPEIPEQDLSLDADEAELGRRVDESGIHTDVTAEIPDGPFAETREGQEELGNLTTTGPSEVHIQQQAAIAASQEQMAELQAQALEAFNRARSGQVGSTSGRQSTMAETENQTRSRLSTEANGVFQTASTEVGKLLRPLTQTAMSMWQSDVAGLTTEFRTDLDRVKGWVDERHSGLGGAIVGVWDSVVGLPSWVTRAYDRAEENFADGVCDALVEISTHVNTVIATVEGIIAQAEQEIRRIFTENLPEGLESWAAEQLAGFERQLGELRDDVEETRTGFLRDVSREAISAVQTVQAEVEALREEAKGLIGKVIDAVAEFVADPVTAIINGLLRLVGIPPASFWALLDKIQQAIADIAADPINFINNLVDAVRQGFQGFFDDFPMHVLEGFWDWFFSGLGDQGVSFPADFSLGSLITFALELMGLTWEAIREILVNHIGEENVELIEKAWELVSLLVEQGIDGVLQMIQDYLDPANLISMILDAAIEYLVTTLIAVVIEKVVSMLNPVGIIAQAVLLIFDVLKWIFNNAARIFRFIETIVNGIADIIAGNVGAMAEAVELALASLIPVVIDFLAGLLRLGGLPDAVADVIKDMREVVLQAVDRAIGFLVGQAMRLIEALGLGGDQEENGQDEQSEDDPDDTELGTEVRFTAEGEAHRHWIDNTGSDAVLMVASGATTVIDKIGEWEGRVDTLVTDDDTATANRLLPQARALAESTDQAADDLASVYAAVAAGTNDTDGDGDNDPAPSDAPVESAQRRLANLLDQLFTLFDGEPDLVAAYPTEIAAIHDKLRPVVETEINGLRPGEKHLVESWSDLKLMLERGRIGRILDRPSHLSSGDFGTAMTELILRVVRKVDTTFSDRRLTARKQWIVGGASNPEYAAIVAALQATAWDSRHNAESAIEASFTTLLNDEVDADVRAAAGSGVDGVVAFFEALSKGDSFGPSDDPINRETFDERVWKRKATKEFLTGRYRLSSGRHEWLPTNMIPEVIQATRVWSDMFEWDDWVQMQHKMRTDTTWIIFKPSQYPGTAQVDGRASRTALSGHAGAVYHLKADGETRRGLVTGQDVWHDRLRDAFDQYSPTATVRDMRTVAEQTVWGGQELGVEFRGPYYQARSERPFTIGALATMAGGRRTGLLQQFRGWMEEFNI